jgi:hypothetical protein
MYKKIIAREFLIFIGSVILYFIINLSWNLIHKFNIEKIERNKSEINKIINYQPLQDLNKLVELNNNMQFTTEKELLDQFPRLKKYSITSIRDFITTKNSGKYFNENEMLSKFPEFGYNKEGFHPNFKKSDFNLINQKRRELEKLENSFFSRKIENRNLIVLGIILFSLTFFMRYIFYAIKWSIKQLRL